MVLGALLYDLLTTGAALLATSAAGEFAKGAGKAAFEALKARLIDGHAVGGLDSLGKPAFADAIKSELAGPGIAGDPEVIRLTEALRVALASVPAPQEARYAIDIRKGIEAARNINLKDIEGIRAESMKAGLDLTLENVKAPPGK